MYQIQRQAKRIKKNSNILNSFIEIRAYVRSLQSEGNKTIELKDFLIYVENEKGYLPTAITPMHILNWLVQTGVVFYRQGLFEDKIILNQEWIISAIYTLFDRENPYSYRFIQENKGVISGKQLNQIWNENSEGEKELFVSFMKSCELCFETTPKEEEYKRVNFEERTFVAPQLLPNKEDNEFWEGRECLYVHYRQHFMHKGIIESFIFRTQEKYSTETTKLWNGCIRLKNGVDFAEVERINDQELQIRITPNAKDLLDKIRNLIDEIISKEINELVSADGKNFVSLNRLEKTDISQNKTILSENEIPIEIEKLLIFLNQDKQNTFKMKQNDLHPIIQKAVKCLQRKDYAGYFVTLDTVPMPLSLEMMYAEHKEKFTNEKIDWDFPQQLGAFTNDLNNQINSSLSYFERIKNELRKHIENSEMPVLFEKIECFNYEYDKNQFTRLKKEFIFGQIRFDFVERLTVFVNGIRIKSKTNQFDDKFIGNNNSARKEGLILTKIPSKMQIRNEHRCIIRIAYDESIIKRDLEDKDITTKRSKKITRKMVVEASDNQYFRVKLHGDSQQIVEEEDYTEWIFDVEPLKLGTFPLSFTVFAIFPDGRKQVILTEKVKVVVEGVDESLISWDISKLSEIKTILDNDEIVDYPTQTTMPDTTNNPKNEGASDKGITINFNPHINNSSNNSSTNNNTNNNTNSQSQQVDFKQFVSTLEDFQRNFRNLQRDVEEKLEEDSDNKELQKAKKDIQKTIEAAEVVEIEAKNADEGNDDAKSNIKKDKAGFFYYVGRVATYFPKLAQAVTNPQHWQNAKESLEKAQVIGGQLGL